MLCRGSQCVGIVGWMDPDRLLGDERRRAFMLGRGERRVQSNWREIDRSWLRVRGSSLLLLHAGLGGLLGWVLVGLD